MNRRLRHRPPAWLKSTSGHRRRRASRRCEISSGQPMSAKSPMIAHYTISLATEQQHTNVGPSDGTTKRTGCSVVRV